MSTTQHKCDYDQPHMASRPDGSALQRRTLVYTCVAAAGSSWLMSALKNQVDIQEGD
jgi:hypothetical protein